MAMDDDVVQPSPLREAIASLCCLQTVDVRGREAVAWAMLCIALQRGHLEGYPAHDGLSTRMGADIRALSLFFLYDGLLFPFFR